MAQGLELIRQELGPDAVILSTKTRRQEGALGFMRPARIEIAAGVLDEPAGLAHEQMSERPVARSPQQIIGSRQSVTTVIEPKPALIEPEESLDSTRAYLQALGLGEEAATPLAAELSQVAPVNSRVPTRPQVAAALAQLLDCVGEPLEPTAIIFVGPTGVGKTTSLAKIAARLALVHGREAALVTVDTYRIGAVEQLRTYADILGLRLEVVRTPSDLPRALNRLAGAEFVLVDTPGRSQRDDSRLRELAEYIGGFRQKEVHLVLSATTSSRELADIVERFQALRPTHYLFSKLDEAVRCSAPFEAMLLHPLPARYVTNGQEVPDDLAVAEALPLVEALMGSENRLASRYKYE